MRTTHTTTIHAQCPLGGWDYYDVSYQPNEFMKAEDFQDACDAVRGKEIYQEPLTEELAGYLMDGELVVTGRHGSATHTVCRLLIAT